MAITQQLSFVDQLSQYKAVIDVAVGEHARTLIGATAQHYTPYSVAAVHAYTNVLERGGKRIRGALTLVGYQMCGGQDTAMIVQAACAIEMVHAYILVLDDIMDKSMTRRGGPSAHAAMASYHDKHNLSGEKLHFGEAIAINSALIGNHYAQSLITSLAVTDDKKLKALKLLNDALITTGHGQINDVFNEVLDAVDQTAVDRVLEWKTAHYTFLNPIQFGMALAGAGPEAVQAIAEYCMHAGRAFQITDDILGTFASEQEAGKSPMDDIREGKRTVLSVAALDLAQSADKNFLITMLGQEKLTQREFNRCKEIFENTGALAFASSQAKIHVAKAKESLLQNKSEWSENKTAFLSVLVESLLGRSK